MYQQNLLYGLVVCGGKSIRMGSDKSMLVYHQIPQRYYLYQMLSNICGKVFISCNSSQADGISSQYNTLVDSPCYENIGPMAALLTAFKEYPMHDFLVTGCDYPYLSENDLTNFFSALNKKNIAGAFYNNEQDLYEPLLAWYSRHAAEVLLRLFQERQYSLQYFLKTIDAEKYFAADDRIIKSADTPESFVLAKKDFL